MNHYAIVATFVFTLMIITSFSASGRALVEVIEVIAEVKISQNIDQSIEQKSGGCDNIGTGSIINNRASNSIINSFNTDVDQRTTIVDSSSACLSTTNTCINGECQTTICKDGECKTTESVSE